MCAWHMSFRGHSKRPVAVGRIQFHSVSNDGDGQRFSIGGNETKGCCDCVAVSEWMAG